MSKSVVVIGSGFSGLSAAIYLASQGLKVDVLEKNSTPGGRARKFESEGFVFNLGPSWYWMPDLIERFFADFGKSPADFYQLKRIDPSYRMFFNDYEPLDVPADTKNIYNLFEKIEPGSASKLKKFLADSKIKYELGIHNAIHKPSKSIYEFLNIGLLWKILANKSFRSVASYVRSRFKDPRLIHILEFPVLFLGTGAAQSPSLYTLMNYADLCLGTWYPVGGMYKMVEALMSMAKAYKVSIYFNSEVELLDVIKKRISCALVNKKTFYADYFVASADYHHVDNNLLGSEHRNYNEKYWDKKILAPSALIVYMGINKKLNNLEHHNLVFDSDLDQHAYQIYTKPRWPSDPAMYVCCTSKTDPDVAPEGCENIKILIPTAPNLVDHGKTRDHYYNLAIKKLEKITGENIRDHIVYHRIYAQADFMSDYHSYKGTAYGLANVMNQTAFLRPSIRHKSIPNLFYAGHLTVPGPGVPPALVSGKLVANEILRKIK
ncbi:MAG: phytoene desaturase family protein [Bacteroidales bacterium]|nr:phytoene desaturase family protein [Bacteroidales bacterium]